VLVEFATREAAKDETLEVVAQVSEAIEGLKLEQCVDRDILSGVDELRVCASAVSCTRPRGSIADQQ
jgi:hypothetical protein